MNFATKLEHVRNISATFIFVSFVFARQENKDARWPLELTDPTKRNPNLSSGEKFHKRYVLSHSKQLENSGAFVFNKVG